MKRRQMAKNELLGMMQEKNRERLMSERAPFTSMSVLCNYGLWRDEGFRQTKLAKYNHEVAAFDTQLDMDMTSLALLSDRLMEKGDFTIQYIPMTEKDLKVSRRNKIFYDMALTRLESDNRCSELSKRYLIIHFNALINMGYGKKRLERHREQINELLAEIKMDDGKKILALRQELIDKAGVVVEMPDMTGGIR